MKAAEGIKYLPDVVDGIDNITLIADDALLASIFSRVKSLLPQSICGCSLVGLNARFRFFRYFPGEICEYLLLFTLNCIQTDNPVSGSVYRPHIDGAWPGSGLDGEGNLVDDIYGDRTSRLTFLMYLNGGFEGGATTFFLPAPDCLGRIESRSVQPQEGSVLVFPHGERSVIQS